MNVSQTAQKRALRPEKYRQKDARTDALRLVHGSQTTRPKGPGDALGTRSGAYWNSRHDWQRDRDRLQEALQVTGWPAEKALGLLAEMDQRQPKD